MKFKLVEGISNITPITDKRMLSLIDDCKKICESVGLHIDPNLKIYSANIGWNTYGYYRLPSSENNVGDILLNDKLINSSDDNIKCVILHELCHYFKTKDDIDKGIILWVDAVNDYQVDDENPAWEDEAHGPQWRHYADILSNKTGYDIRKDPNFLITDENGETKFKYLVVCDNCGFKDAYIKLSKVVQHPELYRCGICGGTLHRENIKKG